MKKITLMLCACAMAFAGLLVSCNNGSEKIIFTDSTSYDYAYTLSGSKVVTVQTATDKAVLLTTTTETTSFEGLANISWSENDNNFNDYKFYALKVNDDIERPSSVKTYAYSGTGASGYSHDDDHVDYIGNFNVPDVDFYSVGTKFYDANYRYVYNNGSPSWEPTKNNGYATYSEADWEDFIDNGGAAITVTGNIEEDDEVTIVVTYSPKDTSDSPAVAKTTTVWTYKLKKADAE